ncbi:uncharacterized protein LOC123481589 [Coregonus clupeaformis]|uniref:uncharacterized protein LOC123481589 n=1 Tax=Coregonus clupeaformis TaxID=59861 RepID=UPI001E1C85D6|nr:uncharacterized protein LOC123481589 [Coregonus clupeaformis]
MKTTVNHGRKQTSCNTIQNNTVQFNSIQCIAIIVNLKSITLQIYFHEQLNVCLKTILYSGVSCEDLTPLKKEEYCLEGTPVTLSYNYSRAATGGDELYLYHQDTAQRPEFLLYISGLGFIKKADPLTTRIFVKLNDEKKHLYLEISSAEVTDSVLYYYAVRPTIAKVKRPLTSRVDVLLPLKEACLLWYRQHPGSSPQFLILDYSGFITNTDSTKWTLTHEKEDNRVDLEISSAEVTDSALYYCGLKPTSAQETMFNSNQEV